MLNNHASQAKNLLHFPHSRLMTLPVLVVAVIQFIVQSILQLLYIAMFSSSSCSLIDFSWSSIGLWILLLVICVISFLICRGSFRRQGRLTAFRNQFGDDSLFSDYEKFRKDIRWNKNLLPVDVSTPPPTDASVEAHKAQWPTPPQTTQPPPTLYQGPFSSLSVQPDETSSQLQPLTQAILRIQRRLDREDADKAKAEKVKRESISTLNTPAILREEMEREREDFIREKLAAERSQINQQLELESAADQARRIGKRSHKPHQPLRIPTGIASPVARNSSWIEQIESPDSTPPRRAGASCDAIRRS